MRVAAPRAAVLARVGLACDDNPRRGHNPEPARDVRLLLLGEDGSAGNQSGEGLNCRPPSCPAATGIALTNLLFGGAVPLALLTVDQVADLLQISRRAVYRLVSAGLPHIRLDGRRLRFRERELERWLDARAIEAAPPVGAPPVPRGAVAPAGGLAPVSWTERRPTRAAS